MKNKKTHLYTDEKESIFRIGKIIFASLVLILLNIIVCLPAVKRILCLVPFYDSVKDNSIELYDIQINLFLGAISTLAIVTAFLEKRYLGASYKYWLFKKSIFFFAPQDIILLMLINQVTGLFSEITGCFRAMALVSFVVCWALFLNLIYQVYIYTVKISRVFCELRRDLLKRKPKKRNNLCNDIYKKVRFKKLEDNYNSYLFEEIEIIIQMMIIYRNQLTDGAISKELTSEVENKIENLRQVVCQMVENEAKIRASIFDSKPHLDGENKILQELVAKTIDKGNALVGDCNYNYALSNSLKPADNMYAALEKWSSCAF